MFKLALTRCRLAQFHLQMFLWSAARTPPPQLPCELVHYEGNGAACGRSYDLRAPAAPASLRGGPSLPRSNRRVFTKN